MIDITEIMKFCIEYKITFEEYMFLQMIRFDKENHTLEFNKMFEQYFLNTRTILPFKKMVDSLEECQFIENWNKGDELLIHKIKLTSKMYEVLNGVVINLQDAWSDVLRVYPKFMYVNNAKINARTIPSPAIKDYYFNSVIKGDIRLHREFIELTLAYFGCEYNEPDRVDSSALAEMGLVKYIYSWETVHEAILEKINGTSTRIVRNFG